MDTAIDSDFRGTKTMSQELTTTNTSAIMERVLIAGDLAGLTPQERTEYYGKVCQSIGLNPLTRPFEYIRLNNKLTLYAKKDCADQLRKINNISISKPDIQTIDGMIVVTVEAVDGTGRRDSDIGVVKKSDMQGDIGNVMMKAITKAKRRVTLSICGLGWLDETEVETVPGAKPVTFTSDGEIIETTAKTITPRTEQQQRNAVNMRGNDNLKSPEPFGEADPVAEVAAKLGGVVRTEAAPVATGKEDPAAKRARLVARLNDANAKLSSAGQLDVTAKTALGNNDNFAALESKIEQAEAALKALQPA